MRLAPRSRGNSKCCQEYLTRPDSFKHIDGRTPAMSLLGCKLQSDWAAIGIDEGMDFSCQPPTRATHATGSLVCF
ncbi:hypothetical protein RsS62_23410 [Rhizobium dioscoreae]|nr:hypothetical protein RsS62_23410 [Rhizobium dioscoreae]